VSPRVAIGVPLADGADHLEEALDSLLTQDFDDFSLVLLGEGATEIAARYAARDPRVTLERPEAAYFAWCNGRDAWHPHWLGSLVAALDADPTAVGAYTKGYMLTASGELGPPLGGPPTTPRRRRFRRPEAVNPECTLFRAGSVDQGGKTVEVDRYLWYRRD
jgi:glycosyltransferase involved in cell wall biosynthesis